MKLHITDGNSKIGKTLNVSMLPILTCATNAPCTKDCYAMKSCVSYPEVLPAWTENTLLWFTRPNDFWAQLEDAFKRKRNPPKFFRWFVGGDIPAPKFFFEALDFARRHPGTKFWMPTKRKFAVEYAMAHPDEVPPNLRLGWSAWPGFEVPFTEEVVKSGHFIAWMRPKEGDPRIPANAFVCPGKCEACRFCYGTNQSRGVIFDKH